MSPLGADLLFIGLHPPTLNFAHRVRTHPFDVKRAFRAPRDTVVVYKADMAYYGRSALVREEEIVQMVQQKLDTYARTGWRLVTATNVTVQPRVLLIFEHA